MVPLVETLERLFVNIWGGRLDNFLVEKVIIKVVVGIFSESWCATPMHRGRLGVLLLTDEASLFLIDLARLKCLLGQAFKEVLLLFHLLFLFFCFFSLGA